MYKKSLYRLYTTGTELSGTPLVYSYSSTKNIKMTVYENGFTLKPSAKGDRMLLILITTGCFWML